MLKEKNYQPRILYPVKYSKKRRNEDLLGQQKLKGIVTSRPDLQEKLKEVFQREKNGTS